MTVIAYKDGVMAADSCEFIDDIRMPCAFPKIVKSPSGDVFGLSGETASCWALSEFFKTGSKLKPPALGTDDSDCFVILLAKTDGTLWRAEGTELRFFPIVHPSVIGDRDASSFVTGAMAAGADAETAVRLAMQHCIKIGGDVQVERVGAD